MNAFLLFGNGPSRLRLASRLKNISLRIIFAIH